MDPAVLFMFTLGALAFGVSITIRIRLQGDRQAYDALTQYLQIPSKGAGAQTLESALAGRIDEAAEYGIRLLSKLDGVATLEDRDAVQCALLDRRKELPHMSISPSAPKYWWNEFETDWRTLQAHAAQTLPAALRHIRRR